MTFIFLTMKVSMMIKIILTASKLPLYPNHYQNLSHVYLLTEPTNNQEPQNKTWTKSTLTKHHNIDKPTPKEAIPIYHTFRQ